MAWGKCLEHLVAVQIVTLRGRFKVFPDRTGIGVVWEELFVCLGCWCSDEPSLWTDEFNNSAWCFHWLQSPLCPKTLKRGTFTSLQYRWCFYPKQPTNEEYKSGSSSNIRSARVGDFSKFLSFCGQNVRAFRDWGNFFVILVVMSLVGLDCAGHYIGIIHKLQ